MVNFPFRRDLESVDGDAPATPGLFGGVVRVEPLDDTTELNAIEHALLVEHQGPRTLGEFIAKGHDVPDSVRAALRRAADAFGEDD